MSRTDSFAAALPHWWPRVLPFACYMLFLAAGPALAPHLPEARAVYAIQIVAAALTLFACRDSYRELRLPQARPAASAVAAAVLLGVAVFVAWIHLDLPLLSVDGGAGFDPRGADGAIDPALAALRVAGAALVVPVMEELFWRSLVMRWLEREDFLEQPPAAVGWRAVFLSSLVFGLEHALWFAGILAGLAYALLYRRSGSLWAPIIAHATTNLLLGCWILYSGNWQFW